MGSEGFGSAMGKAGRDAAAVVDVVAALVDGFDPELMGPRDAMDLVEVFSRIEHLASAGVALAARRVAKTDLWSRRGGHRSGAHWLAHVTGMGVGDAVKLLQTAEAVEHAPDTREALRAGAVSTRQAKAIGRAETVDPDAGKRLLAVAATRSARELEDESARVVRAASTESEAERVERVRRGRFFRTWTDDDGGHGSFCLPPAEFTRFMAALDAKKARVFEQARKAGRRDHDDAYAADALVALADRPAGHTAADGDVSDDAGHDDWSFAKVIVRVDAAALDRGELAAGEVCEIAGRGPIPVTDARRMICHDAFVAAISTNGVEIHKVVHLGRKATALQRTALEWLSAGECSIEGCTSPARLEIDHVADWADTNVTRLGDLTGPCGHHHDLKTHHHYQFGPLLPSGKRQLIPPDARRSSTRHRRPGQTHRPPNRARSTTHPPPGPERGPTPHPTRATSSTPAERGDYAARRPSTMVTLRSA